MATETSGLPIRTTLRSLTNPAYKVEQELVWPAKALNYGLFVLMSVTTLGVVILVYRWNVAPWLSVAAAVGLGLCAARLAYWYARGALVIPRSWGESDNGALPRKRLFWPSLMALSGALALIVSIAGFATGHAPVSGWTNTEVIGGAAVFALGGALMTWARAQPDTVQPADLSPDAMGAPVAEPL
jgi:hypothetical protein